MVVVWTDRLSLAAVAVCDVIGACIYGRAKYQQCADKQCRASAGQQRIKRAMLHFCALIVGLDCVSLETPMPTYGQTITWVADDGTKASVVVEDCDSPEEALHEAMRSARACGWKPPRWWQWWRWR